MHPQDSYNHCTLVRKQGDILLFLFSQNEYCILYYRSDCCVSDDCCTGHSNDMQTLYESLTNVSKHIKPRINQSQSVNVDVMFAMNTIQDYDEISGNLVFTASFAFFWKDEFKMWNPLNYNGIINTQLPIMKTWVPALVLRNGVNQNSLFTFSNMMDIETTMVTIHCRWGCHFKHFRTVSNHM